MNRRGLEPDISRAGMDRERVAAAFGAAKVDGALPPNWHTGGHHQVPRTQALVVARQVREAQSTEVGCT